MGGECRYNLKMKTNMAKKYALHDILTFGKYRGRTLRQVLSKDAKYVQWCLGNVHNFSMDNPAWDYAISVSSSFETYRPKSSNLVAKRDSLPYSDGIEVLLHNPWGDRILKCAASVAEDILPCLELHILSAAPRAIQLQIPFDTI